MEDNERMICKAMEANLNGRHARTALYTVAAVAAACIGAMRLLAGVLIHGPCTCAEHSSRP
ncbi:hypothetical protein [Nonomuraea salmonea]|uniref:Uncharacterized protein n=1 Tax=Nonomuraea salmonea TaxID=46181 RepID=A0ABV5P370_9ACTN